MATPRDTEDVQEEETAKKEGPHLHPYDDREEFDAYTQARLNALSLRMSAQEERHRRFVLVLIIVAYALVFGYLVGRDNAPCQR